MGRHAQLGSHPRLLASLVALLAAGCEDAVPEAREPASAGVQVMPIEGSPAQFQSPNLSVARGTLRPLAASEAVVATDRFNSARVCGACHGEIFEKWSNSMHALAYDDPIFQASFLKAYYDSAGEAAALCLRCHSPTIVETRDFLGKLDLTREGVTCDYCHSMSSITQDAAGQARVTIDHSARHSPFEQRGEAPEEHAVQWRPYFERSEVCAPCHDYTAPNGTVVFATYSEWKTSESASSGEQCQDCHMPRLRGDGQGVAGREVFNDHNLQGGHSPAQVMRAVTAAIEELVRDGDRIRVVVAIENSGAGHSVPTGLPSKMLAVSVSATQTRRTIFRREVIYQRVMQGEDHRALDEAWQIKLHSRHVLRDNRLRPGEARREIFVFDAAPNDDVIVRLEVVYRFRPKLDTQQLMEIPIMEFEKILARGL